ncbi:MAG: hypothetical protein QOI80_3043 [Solirubrobacteraceae bacterium]|nr:hypothetical protein [Solirubrobacteraceae bacterium]
MKRPAALLAAASAAYTPVPLLELSTHAPSAAPAITSTLTQPGGQAATRTISATFPHDFTYNPRFHVPGCEPADEQAASCPADTRLGTIEVTSPFGQATGPVHLMRDLRLVAFLGAYAGLVQMRMVGQISVHDDGAAEIVFDDLPDIPATYGRIALDGGDRGALVNPRRCGHYTVHSRLVSHQGDVVEQDLPVSIEGCGAAVAVRRPRVAGRVLRWALSEPAVTRVVLFRDGRAGWRQVGAWRRARTQLRLPRLRAGAYRVLLRATSADGRTSPARSVRFVVGSRAP